MNAHPNYFGRGVAAALLKYIIDYADRHDYPAVRLTQSAMNLDSYSLYTRAGFTPRSSYQNMIMEIPESGFPHQEPEDRIRPAAEADVEAMKELEREVAGIFREKDCRHCIQNREGIWDSLIFEETGGEANGFMVSCKHAALNMLGPCVSRTEGQAAALIARSAARYRGGHVLAAVPAHCAELVRRMYQWRARNCGIFRPRIALCFPFDAFVPIEIDQTHAKGQQAQRGVTAVARPTVLTVRIINGVIDNVAAANEKCGP